MNTKQFTDKQRINLLIRENKTLIMNFDFLKDRIHSCENKLKEKIERKNKLIERLNGQLSQKTNLIEQAKIKNKRKNLEIRSLQIELKTLKTKLKRGGYNV